MAADFDGPLQDFYERTQHIRRIIVAIESASRNTAALTTVRTNVDLAGLGLHTGNTVNSMSLVFLASSFEEFVREELSQCATELAIYYKKFPEDVRHSVRSSYWAACLDTFRFNGAILTRNKPKVPDSSAISKLKGLLESARGFVVDDDAASIDSHVMVHHMHNFRPGVLDELAGRLGIKSLVDEAAESAKLKSYFGVSKRHEAAKLLRSKLAEFYDKRNGIVHSLNSTSGYAVDVVIDYIELFEGFADSIKGVLVKTTAKWTL